MERRLAVELRSVFLLVKFCGNFFYTKNGEVLTIDLFKKFPVIPFLGLISCLLMLTQFDLFVLTFGVALLGFGTIVFTIYKKITNNNSTQKIVPINT